MDRFLLQPGDVSLLGGYPQKTDGLPVRTPTFEPSLCLPLIAFRQSLSMSATVAGDGHVTPTGAPSAVFTVTKAVSPFSVRFYDFCLRAKTLGVGADQPTYLHLVRDEDGTPTLTFSIALREALVSAIELQAQPDGSTVEQLTLNAREMTWVYTLAPDAGGPAQFRSGFSLTLDKAIISFT